MGNNSTIDIQNDELLACKLGSVKENDPTDGKEVDLYYQPGKAFFTMQIGEIALSKPTVAFKKCRKIIPCEQVYGVSTFEDFLLNDIGSTYRISILKKEENSDKFEILNFYFKREEDFVQAQLKLDEYNFADRDGVERNICVLVNPISGKKVSREYYFSILKPVLSFNSIKHSMFETQSATYIEEFITELDVNQTSFNEFVVIGGDGVFSQLLNALMKHSDSSKLIKFPIGIIPGGSTNSLCCALSGKNPYMASKNIANKSLLKGDIFRVNMNDSKKSIYSTALTYGLPSDLVIESENLRNIFGRYRYIATAVPKFIKPTKFPVYESEVFYKLEDDHQQQSSTDDAHIEGSDLRVCGISIPKIPDGDLRSDSTLFKFGNEWKKINIDEFLFHAIITHENRSSVGKDVNAPFARIDDGFMYLFGLKKCSRIEALTFLSRASKGTQVDYEKYFYQKATELRFKNPCGSYFCSDGEPYKSDDYTVKLLPGFVNLMGETVKE
ncbi:unnamed protein product [Moneuplotes crassus]|uniref:DAGKc domain-containing protein n=1 Tax=Euplotes crassus TaxID=5936 RepID=A0AAD1UII0_EUPCR|nr:unnamed protein product [Moneuplotes crassus]